MITNDYLSQLVLLFAPSYLAPFKPIAYRRSPHHLTGRERVQCLRSALYGDSVWDQFLLEWHGLELALMEVRDRRNAGHRP